jgi:uncharacterized protein YjbJ (UPF0337 family)
VAVDLQPFLRPVNGTGFQKGSPVMNWDQIEGKWKQMRGSARQQWGKLTDDDLEAINGQRDKLVGKLQERYGIAREEAQRRADDWLNASMSRTSDERTTKV